MTLSQVEVVEGKHLFVVGASNTGSTVLYRWLAYHPDFAWFSQWSNRDWTIPGRVSFPLSARIDRFVRGLVAHPWSKVNNAGPFERAYQQFVPRPGDGGAAWGWVFPQLDSRAEAGFIRRVAARDFPIYGPDQIPAVRDRLIALIQRNLEIQNKVRFLGKRPPLCFAVPALAEVFPNAKFIHTIRDAQACVITRASRSVQNPDHLERVRLIAMEWNQTMQFMGEMADQLGRERLVEVRHEEACKDVRGTISKLFAFCDLPRDEAVLRRLPAQIRSTNERRIAQMPEDCKRVILEAAGEQLHAWGYLKA